ncbi:MAG: glycosyltransferase family 2 protein [Nitrososphaerota archaeon]|nr:glycosyltransferase family 2 protein [Nitrososphaerota archaeon]
MNRPTISVIAIAHNRKNFIEYALSSAINQTLPKELYEIIFITNIEVNPDLLESGNIKTIYSNIKEIGPEVSMALTHCQGEIICLLDDDDEWAPEKLERVYSIFSQHPELCYYHNGMIFIDESGKEIIPDNQLTDWKKESREFVWLHPRSGPKPIDSIVPMSSFNNSCISIRKHTLQRYTAYLEKINRTVDRFLFYSSVLDDCGILSDSAALTRYRVHESSSSVHNIRDFKSFSTKQSENSRAYSDDFGTILRMCNQVGDINLQHELDILRLWFKFNGDLFSHDSRQVLLMDFVEVMKLLVSTGFNDRWLRIIAVLSILSLLCPGLPRRIIFNYYSKNSTGR